MAQAQCTECGKETEPRMLCRCPERQPDGSWVPNPNKFTQKDFLIRLEELYAGNVKISAKKNCDYASWDDPFKNFRLGEMLGVSVEQQLISLMGNKIGRISNLLGRGDGPAVADESVKDTLSDLANYSMILRMYLERKDL